MGWGRTLLMGDIGNRLDIEDVERDVAKLADVLCRQRRVDGSQDARIDQLEAEVCELKLYLATVIRLLVSKGSVTREEFARLVEAIDRTDGSEDGQFRGDIATHRTWTGDGPEPASDDPGPE